MPGASNRFEERLAIALWRMWRTPASGPLRLLDYQVPLKARRSDRKIGKVDLLGVTDGGRLKVIELKVKRRGNRGDSPMFALMEGLRYAAIIEANREAIAEEARKYGEDISGERPIVQILAPRAWWRGWFELAGRTRRVVGAWEAEFAALAVDIEELLGILVECTALDDVEPTDIEMGADERQPQVDRMLALYPVLPGEAQPIGRPLGVPPAGS